MQNRQCLPTKSFLFCETLIVLYIHIEKKEYPPHPDITGHISGQYSLVSALIFIWPSKVKLPHNGVKQRPRETHNATEIVEPVLHLGRLE